MGERASIGTALDKHEIGEGEYLIDLRELHGSET
jgi:hypothetical protein